MREIALALLTIYQKVLTLLSYGSCRYYPTCSEYARWRIETDSLIIAPFAIFLRVLRCNPLFPGGIDYPIIYKKIENPHFRKIEVRYWLVPKGGNFYYLIKNLY
ncbi:MAG: membrane protein insertion efficiency factor YidD [Epsilonproteobacteria bacterium]|nr:membrane protein insertion efficiency factor YidD [Campylobacterota bacterium]NPA56124.1 membrane protein insertion efficiency factor YidD [Campylobacterota bacterium]